jgi:DNA primase
MSDIDEVKSRLNIVDIISAKVPLKKAGHNFKGLCPFHNEKTPSFMVSPDRQSFHCFGCGKGGSVIDFVMEYEHVDFVEALETLAEKAGVKLERRTDETPQGRTKTKILEVNHLASEFYHYILTSHKLGEKARLYLKERGVTDKTVKTFMLGYSPNSWDGLAKFLRKKGYDEKLLETAGLLISSARGGYDRFRGRVMFALRDHRGNVVGFSGRLLDKETKEAKYINTSETPVYIKGNMLYGLDVTKGAIQKENEAIVMEGEFDVISSFQEGISNVVAIKGSALTEAHVNLIRRFAERITFALDSDMAGDAASRRGIDIAQRAGLDLRVVAIPNGKDPDEAVREDPVLFKKAIKNAVPIYDYFLDSAMKRFDPKTSFGKKKISEELIPHLAAIENPVVQSHYMKLVGEALDVSEDVIAEGVRRLLRSSSYKPKEEDTEKKQDTESHTRAEKLELYMLAILLQTKTIEYYEDLKEHIASEDLIHQGVRQIVDALGKYIPSHTPFLLRDFADSLPKELIPVVDEAFLWDISGFADDEELVAREWTKMLIELRKQTLHTKVKALTMKLNAGQNDKAVEIQLGEVTRALGALEKMSPV